MIVERLSPAAVQIGWALDWLGIILWELEMFRCCCCCCCIVKCRLQHAFFSSHIWDLSFVVVVVLQKSFGEDHQSHLQSNKLLKIGWMPIGNIHLSTYVLFIYLDMSCLLLECVIMSIKIKLKKEEEEKSFDSSFHNDKSMDGFEVSLCNGI